MTAYVRGRTHSKETGMGKFAGKKKSKVSAFARGAAASETREQGEEFDLGSYRVRFKEAREADNGSIGISFTGAGDDEEIGDRVQWFSTKGKAAYVSGPRVKSLCMALLGMGKAEEDQYNEFDPNGEFLDAIVRGDLDAAAEYLAENTEDFKNAKKALARLQEAEVIVKVSKGGEKDDGGFFKNASFRPATDEGDDSEEDEDDEPESERRPAKKKAAAKRKPSRDEEDEDEDDSDDEDDSEEDEDDEPPPRKSKASKKAKGRK